MNHELNNTQGVAREHGSIGAFVSSLTIDKASLQVVEAHDLVQDVFLYNTGTGEWDEGTTIFNRLCSADLRTKRRFTTRSAVLAITAGGYS